MTMPSSPLQRSESGSKTFSIQELVRLALTGSLRIPRFQRPFVWDANDVRKLFDSLYRGFPVGTLLLWRQSVPAASVSFGGVHVEAEASSGAYMVVDGQQRLTALVASLASPVADRDERFEVYFDLAKHRFVGPIRGTVPPRSIPVREALESRSLLTWLRTNGDTLEDGDLDIADDLGGALRDYKVPAYVVEGDDERLLREVFDRVNSAGKPMTRAQVFHALFANDAQPGSPATVVESLRGLGFGEIPENRVVQTLLAIRGGDVQRDLHDEFDENEDPADWYEQTERALDHSIRFLQSIGVAHERLMPSGFPLPVLSAFFHLYPEPDSKIMQLLERWLWRGWMNGFGRESGQTPALRRAVRSINPRKGAPVAAPGEYAAVKALLEPVRDAPVTMLDLSNFRADHAQARAVLVWLADLGPLDPRGEPLDVPRAFNEYGSSVVGSLLPGSKSELGNRGFWLPDWPDAREVADHVLASHGTPLNAVRALRASDTELFVRLRGENLAEKTMARINSRIAAGLRPQPPVTSLMVADPGDLS